MPGFDFHALAARAHADNPDAAVFDAIEAIAEQSRLGRRAPRAVQRRAAWAEENAARERLAACRPATPEGLLAKLRHVTAPRRGAKSRPSGPGLLALPHGAMLDAVAWLEGSATVGASDAALLEAIEADKAAFRDFGRALARLRRRQADHHGSAATGSGSDLHRLATASCEARDRVAAARPETLEGLAAKLRHAERRMHRCPTSELQHAVLLDAIAWLGPRKRNTRARRADVRTASAAP